MKLYTLPASPNTIKVVALIHHLGLEVEQIQVDLQAGANRLPDYLAKNPNGLMPVLEDGDFHLWESNAILIYLAQKKPEAGLFPSDPRAQAQVQQWLFWQSIHWGACLRPFLFERLIKPMFLGQPSDESKIEEALGDFQRYAAVLEERLAGHDYLVGGRLSIADFAVVSPLIYSQPARIPLDGFPKVQAYVQRVTGTEAWGKALPPMPARA